MPTSDYAPSVDDIGALLRARTKDNTGTEVGTFNANTRPTDAQVSSEIQGGLDDVAMVVGTDIPQATFAYAREVAKIATALRVELGYFPEQVNTGRSPYPQLKQMFDDKIKMLLTAVEKAQSGDTTDPGAPLKPSFSFPQLQNDPTIVGRSWPRW